MDGDITRNLFDPLKDYSSVRSQQGRLQVDADANEAVDIQLHDSRTALVDLLGRHGAPQGSPGMEITALANQVRIGPGRYYVDGIRCELRADDPVSFEDQPHLPEASLPSADGLYLLYLDVWERPISAVQDPEIREVALGGPDTCTRTQVVWQVKALAVTTNDPTPTCATPLPEWATLLEGPTGTLQVRVEEPAASTNPCLVPESAGFRGLQNHLYRFAIHEGNFAPAEPTGDDGTTTSFKWSRDNGAVVGAWRDRPEADEIVVDRLGPGAAQGLEVGQWLEFTDDFDDLAERSGVLARIDGIDADHLTMVDATAAIGAPDVERHPQMRRWDSPGSRGTTLPAADPDNAGDGWIRIEDGIQVRFGEGTYRAGDHWLLPARTALLPGSEDSQIDWPREGGAPVALRPMGRRHHYARLALVRREAGAWSLLDDCRNLFPPLTELLQLEHRGGDGQHARSGRWLPAPIRVAVMRGTTPVAGASLRFSVVAGGTDGAAELSGSEPDPVGNVAAANAVLDVQTDADGIARVWWRLGAAPLAEVLGDDFQSVAAQVVEVTVLDPEGDPTALSTRFVAHSLDNVTLTPAGGNGQLGIPGEYLEIALRVRVADGSRPIQGARVAFSALGRMLDGHTLDEFTGGSIHASANVVSSTLGPNGSRMIRAIVETDAQGEAQVQQILGTELGLPVQSVRATLLDEEGAPTAQTTLFTSHLAIASEVQWQVCPPAVPFLGTTSTVQRALDLHCTAIAFLLQWAQQVAEELGEGGNGGGAIDFSIPAILTGRLGPVVVDTTFTSPVGGASRLAVAAFLVAPDGSSRALESGGRVRLAELAALEFELSAGALGRGEHHVAVVASVPQRTENVRAVVGDTLLQLRGTISVVEGRVRWTPADGVLDFLRRSLGAQRGVDVTVDAEIVGREATATVRRRFQLTP